MTAIRRTVPTRTAEGPSWRSGEGVTLRAIRVASLALLGSLSIAVSVAAAEPPAAAAGSDRLLVIAPDSFRDALAEYLEARSRQLGGPVEFLSLEAVLADGGEAADHPERIKRELHRRWKAGGLTAVLLVGDADIMPVRFMMLDRGTAPAFDTAFYPSDLYYADLARDDGSFDDWNASRDGAHAGYFGEVHGETRKSDPINFDRISYRPEIAVGRWPVSTPEAAKAVASKTLRHQDAVAAAGAGAPPVCFIFSGGWIDNAAQARRLLRTLGEGERWAIESHAYFTPDRPANREAAGQVFAAEPAAVFHTGHGQPWGWEGCLDRGVLAAAPATDRPPLLFSIGCSTAVVCTLPPYEPYLDADGREHEGTNAGEVFDDFPPAPAVLQPGRFNAGSLSEEALRRPDGGAIAVIGCVTGSQPCAHTLLDAFVEAMHREPSESAGRWWSEALGEYVRREKLMDLVPTESWYPPSIFFQGMKFIYLGDPTIRLRK